MLEVFRLAVIQTRMLMILNPTRLRLLLLAVLYSVAVSFPSALNAWLSSFGIARPILSSYGSFYPCIHSGYEGDAYHCTSLQYQGDNTTRFCHSTHVVYVSLCWLAFCQTNLASQPYLRNLFLLKILSCLAF